MPIYEHDEIRGIIVAGQVFCPDCMDGEGVPDGDEVEILTERDLSARLYVCDSCKCKV